MQTHSQRLETWLGVDTVAGLSDSMRTWYGPPIAMMGVPGNVYACGGGGFSGAIKAGSEVSAIERAEGLLKRSARARRLLLAMQHRQVGMAGFSSLSDLIEEAKTGKSRELPFNKAGTTATALRSASFFKRGTTPVAGADAAAAPGGTVPGAATTGGFVLDSVSPDTRHFVYGAVAIVSGGGGANALLLYDRIFAVAKTMNSTATEAVTGVPTRYQSGTATAADYIGGNFLFVEVGGTALAATAHDWTVCTYTDQASGASTLPTLTGVSAAAVVTYDHPANQWFAPLASGDTGIKALTQMQCSALVATGQIDFVIGHPIAFMPCPLGLVVCVTDGINTAFNLARVFDDACLALIEVIKPSSTGSTYTGSITLVHG